MISALPTFLGSVRSPAVPCVCCLCFYIVVGVFTFLWVYLHFCGRLNIPVGVFTVGVFFLWAFLHISGRFYLCRGRFYIAVGVFTFLWVYLHFCGHFKYPFLQWVFLPLWHFSVGVFTFVVGVYKLLWAFLY
jgi:hypothetical protein